ncbi:MAG: hypothetical protein LQ347_000716 [Umbilicaria vellea]|nr:MAG: hypothetical protein LQ347_000716 [Umbilicaria vellea]
MAPVADIELVADIKGGKGNADALFITEIPKPQPKESDAIVKVKAFGLNRMDLLQREGQYPVPPQAPKTLGVEFSGVIESFGGGAESSFKVGDEVFGLAYGATQAMYLVGEFAPGKSMLWHAGASSVSIAGIQLSRADNASAIYVTAGSQEKVDFCKELGATAGFNYHNQDWAQEILNATDGKGVDIVIDFIGQNYFQGNLDVAAKDGRIVHLGAMSGTKLPAGVDMGAFIRKRLRFEGSSLRSRDTDYQRKLRNTLEDHALPKFKDGSYRLFVEKVFPFEEIVQAHKLMEQNVTKGKIICTIG